MKVVITKAQLIELITKVQNIVSPKPAISILANILIEAVDDQLILTTTDLTTSMRTFVDAKVIEEGAIALPARRFFQLIRELTSPQIKITALSSEIAEIVSGSSTFKIHGMHKNEFPKIPEQNSITHITIKSNLLKDLFSKTYFCAAREDSRQALNGILLQIAGQKLSLLATDGKRLARVQSPIDIDPSFQGSYVLPYKAIEEMTKMLSDSDEMATLGLTHDKISLEYYNLILITKLLSGQYPAVERAIPSSPTITLQVHREELMSLLRQISLFTSDTASSARFQFTQGNLLLSAMNREIGEGNVSMAIDYQGQGLEIAFNPFYFIDFLRHSQDEIVQLGLVDSYSPALITDTTSTLFVLMPMRLKESQTPSVNDQKPAFA